MAQFDNEEDDLLGKILAQASAASTGEMASSLPEEAAPQPNDIDMAEQQDATNEIASLADNLEMDQPEEKAMEPAPQTEAPPVPPWKKLQEQAEQAFGKYEKNLGGQRLADLSTLPGRYLLGMGDPASLEKTNEALTKLPVTSLEGKQEALKKGLDTEQLKDANDPNSDISKFAREQAGALLKRLNPDADISLLTNMTAANLEKLGLIKGMGASSLKIAQQSDYETEDGQPLSFNPVTNNYTNILSGETYTGPVRRKVLQGYYDPHSGERVLSDTMGRKTVLSGAAPAPKEPDSETRRNLHPKDKALLDKTRDSLTADKGYINAKEALDGSENAEALLLSGQTTGQDLVRAIQTMLAKSSGQVGVLTEQDVAGFNGRANALARLERAISIAQKGKLPEEDRKFLLQYVKTMKKAAERNIKQVGATFSTQLADDLGTSVPQAEKLLNISNRVTPPLKDEKPEEEPLKANEEARQTTNGRTAVFDKTTKKFLRYR